MKWAWHKLAQFQAKSPVWVRLAGRFGLGVALMIAVCAGLAACTGGPHPEPPLPSFGASPDGGAHHETGSGGASPSGSAGSGGAGISAGSGGASASDAGGGSGDCGADHDGGIDDDAGITGHRRACDADRDDDAGALR
jgi:hypothetical protein